MPVSRTQGVRVVTTPFPFAESAADCWTSGLTDSRDLRCTHIRVADPRYSTSFLTAPRICSLPEGSREIPWLGDVEDEIRSYMELGPNWDSYGGGPARGEIVDCAVAIVEIMARIGFTRPDVSPESSGGVLLEWEQDGRALIVDLDGIGGFSFAYDALGKVELEGDIEDFFGLLGAGLRPF